MLCFVIFGYVVGLCPDETISGYTDPATIWRLVEMDGEPVEIPATVEFPDQGEVRGSGPCNTFTAIQSIDYPWIAIERLSSTKTTCPDIAFEAAYFMALTEMTLAEASPSILLLTGKDGIQMVFSADSPETDNKQ